MRYQTIDELADQLAQAWTKSTSADPERWSRQNPALGQCAVTALVVQDLFGGDLLRAQVRGVSHYWNRLPSGQEVDLTRQQFGDIADFPAGEFKTRGFVLSFPDTVERYLSLSRTLGLSSATEVAPSDR
jgi:hypothetical protein